MWYSFWSRVRGLLNKQDRNRVVNAVFHLANRLCLSREVENDKFSTRPTIRTR